MPLGEGRFSGKKPYRLSLSVPASLLQEGANTLQMQNVGDTGVYSLVFLDKVSVSFPQAAVARGGAFEGRWDEGGTVEVAGVTVSPAVLDVTLAGVADSSSPDTAGAPRNDSCRNVQDAARPWAEGRRGPLRSPLPRSPGPSGCGAGGPRRPSAGRQR